MKIGWITDIHLGKEGDPAIRSDLIAYLEYACKRYDHVVITGDLIHPMNRFKFHHRFSDIASIIQQYGPDKIRVIPGNHDRAALLQQPSSRRANQFWDSAWGNAFPEPGYTAPIETEHDRFVIGHFSVLTDMEVETRQLVARGDGYSLSPSDLRCIEREMQMLEEGQRLHLFTHIPLLSVTNAASGYQNVALAHQIFAEARASVQVLSGHWHEHHMAKGQGFQQMVLPAFFKRQEPVGSEIARPNAVISAEHGRVIVDYRRSFPRPKGPQ